MNFDRAALLCCVTVLLLLAQISAQSRNIFVKTARPVHTTDKIILEGTFPRRPVMTRFFSNCSSGTSISIKPHCQPLIIKFRPAPKFRKMEVFYRGLGHRKDVRITTVKQDGIVFNRQYRLVVEVQDASYVIFLNGERLAEVPDRIGHNKIDIIRSYGGGFSEYYVAHNEGPGIDLRSEDICGTRPGMPLIQARIVGGADAGRGEFPWQTSMRRKSPPLWAPSKHLCGGSLISSCWIVTAAHCVHNIRRHLNDYYFRVGDFYNKDDEANSDYKQYEDQHDFNISQVIVHENYTSNPLANDIALVRLESSTSHCVTFSDLVRPICLPKLRDRVNRKACLISGWGAQNFSDSSRPSAFPSVLQKAQVKLWDFLRCRISYGLTRRGQQQVTNGTLCASGPGTDTCQGDSGGPLTCRSTGTDRGTPYILWGVTSWGEGCGNPDKPGIYTKVLDYVGWIFASIAASQE